MTIRPFVTASSLDDFDEKASLSERTRWWERFQTLAFQGGWSDKMKVYELRLKFSKEFKVKYCKSKMSDSEKYYTMKQRKAETPLDFLYRLNAAADRADIRYKKSERRREQHVKRFTHRLADSQLKSILKSQRFKSMDDLEYVLKQRKMIGMMTAKTSGDESDSDERHVVFEDETLEIPPTQENVEPREALPENQGLGMTMEELTQHVLKVMENSGWNKPGHMAHQGKTHQSNGHPESPSQRPSL
ncbi:hypothetical protein PHMEG_00039802 [Phytophthora megakarya]|uniref:Retrotransposon gag domain-containing protein n=1 Tax=Phytophthora megakarya TaxID=4795 RepID=A0A225UF17_9STRA|nr:hypothetical protein PHMEG_00039802 [Phytophthora megakarya]